MTTVIEISKDYGLVLLASTAIAIEYFFTPIFFTGPVRKRVFTKEFLEKNFGQVHKLEVGDNLPRGGYPDMGTGRYSQLLSYKDWLDLNNAQRVHLNFNEQIGVIIPFTLIAGLKYPRAAAYLGLGYFVSRIIYGVGYTRKPDARLFGYLGVSLITITLAALAGITGYKIFAK